MFKVLAATWPLLLGVMLLMVGNGVQASLLASAALWKAFPPRSSPS